MNLHESILKKKEPKDRTNKRIMGKNESCSGKTTKTFWKEETKN